MDVRDLFSLIKIALAKMDVIVVCMCFNKKHKGA